LKNGDFSKTFLIIILLIDIYKDIYNIFHDVKEIYLYILKFNIYTTKDIIGGMKLEPMEAITKARKISSSTVGTIPKGMAELLGIKPGTPLHWKLDPEKGIIELRKLNINQDD
jgi:hypothetical protein